MTQIAPRRTVEEYMELPYRMEVYWDEGCWAAEFPDLPGLVAAHETWEGLREAVDDAKRAWFDVALEHGDPIPEPRPTDEHFSGKLNIRLPRSLHAAAARAAEREGVSLNTFLVTAIAKELGARVPVASPTQLSTPGDATEVRQQMQKELDAVRMAVSGMLSPAAELQAMQRGVAERLGLPLFGPSGVQDDLLQAVAEVLNDPALSPEERQAFSDTVRDISERFLRESQRASEQRRATG